MIRFTLALSDEINAKVKDRCNRLGVNRNSLIVMALKTWLDQQDGLEMSQGQFVNSIKDLTKAMDILSEKQK